MTSRSLARKQLSRSKLDLFLECPRCFFDDVVRGVSRVSGPTFTLNNAVDGLLKSEFDGYRQRGEPHPIFESVGLDAVPFAHPEMDAWRQNFKGVRWTDAESGWTLFGAVDDVWRLRSGAVAVADYKATAKAKEVTESELYPGYRRQAEVYQFLLERQGLEVDSRAWFVYANGRTDVGSFEDKLRFRTKLIPYHGDRSWVLETFRSAVAVVEGGQRPAASAECKWCAYVSSRAG